MRDDLSKQWTKVFDPGRSVPSRDGWYAYGTVGAAITDPLPRLSGFQGNYRDIFFDVTAQEVHFEECTFEYCRFTWDAQRQLPRLYFLRCQFANCTWNGSATMPGDWVMLLNSAVGHPLIVPPTPVWPGDPNFTAHEEMGRAYIDPRGAERVNFD